ncbi:cytochrome P450 [Rhizodiscina lignyota]|uniref:Cytochrome P450 n=1 Tax=Rhizodiscina lignyota TaxID=1504668 RepID=A0A9P4IBE5_9PEZI|nr:cytochrome P450 [Rhizodiscina lignyota]
MNLQQAFIHCVSRAARFSLLGITLGLTCILLICSYNLFFHPLRNVPGPFLARISRLWTRIGNYNGVKAHRIHAAHQRYGNIVRVSPNELSFADPAAVREIYMSDAFAKEETFYRAKRVFHEEMIMSLRDQDAHKARRKMLSRGFSQAAMLDFESTIADKTQVLMDQWARLGADGKPVDVYPWCLWLGFDTVYHLMFDEDPGSLRQGRAPDVMKYLRAWRPLFTYKEFVPQLEQYGVHLPGNVGNNFRLVEEWKNMAMKLVQNLRTRGSTTPFLRFALAEKDAHLGRPLTDSELAEEAMGGMFGGTGTTGNTFVYLLWGVLQQPSVTKKLREELQQVSEGRDETPSYTALAQLPFLQACLNETLRLYPTIIATLPRTALRDTTVCGVAVPRGTIVGTQNYTLHRSASAFPQPEAFMPERWLDSQGRLKDDERMKEAFVPFSVGPRKCIGLNLAQMELTKATAAFFLRFQRAEVDWDAMREGDMDMFDCFSASPRGTKLILKLWEKSS